METYQQKQGQWNFIKGVSVVAGAAAAFLGRRQIARGVLSGIEKATERFAPLSRASARFKLTSFANEISQFTNARLEQQAIQQIGESRMRDVLLTQHKLGADAVDELFRGQGRAGTWTAHQIDNAAELLRGRAYSEALRRSGKSAEEMAVILEDTRVKSGIFDLYARDKAAAGDIGRRNFGANSRDARWKAQAANIQAQISQAQDETEKAFIEKLRGMASPYEDRRRVGLHAFERFSGSHEATLGDVSFVNTYLSKDAVAELKSTRTYIDDLLAKHDITDLPVDDIRIGGLWKNGNKVYDLRGAAGLGHKIFEYAGNEFQIPLIPYVSGFNPLSMFPWASANGYKDVAFAGYKSIGQQLGISDLVAGRQMGVASIRGQAIGYEFADGATKAATVLADGVGAYDATHGFGRKMAESFASYYSKESSSPTTFFGKVKDILSIGQPEQSNIDRLKSVFGKRNADDYAATAFKKIFTGENARNKEALEVNLKTLGGFLRSEGSFSPEAMKAAYKKGMFAGSAMEDVLANFDSPEAVIQFYGTSGYQAHSKKLRSLLEEFSRDPEGVLRMSHRPRDRSLLQGMSVTGSRQTKRSIDIMREGLAEEVILRYGMPAESGGFTPLAESILGSGLSAADKQNAVSFIHGVQIQRELELNGIEEANKLVTSSSLSDSIFGTSKKMVDERLSFLDTHLPLPDDSEIPNTFFMREHHSIFGELGKNINDNGVNIAGIAKDFFSSNAVKQYSSGFFNGVKDPSTFTSSTGVGYFFASRLNSAIGEWGLGLSSKDLGSGYDIMKGLVTKRILPGFAAYETWNYLNSEGDDPGELSPRKLVANVKANTRLAGAWLFGNEHSGDLFPGLDRYISGNTYEEEKEQLATGYTPVRQGRYWLFGSRTQFTGDKVKYYLPDSYQRAYSGWESADNADLGSDDYWANSALPSLRYPLSPIRHFLTDPYAWENKHSTGERPDRPYVESAPLFSNGTPWGPILNATVGAVLKPTRVLYPEYSPRAGGGIPGANTGLSASGGGGATIASQLLGSGSVDSKSEDGYNLYAAQQSDSAEFLLHDRALAEIMPAGGINITSSGVGAVGNNLSLSQRVRTRSLDGYSPNIAGSADSPEDLQYMNLDSEAVQNAQDVAGIYGWFAKLATGGNPSGVRVDDAGHATDFSNRFYSANIGGLGGVVNEIGRRFLRKRPGTVEYYNPVPNAFVNTFLPDQRYFKNFERGDIYTSNENGLLRLPGEAYEKVHGIKLMQAKADILGSSVSDQAMAMLHMSAPDENEQYSSQDSTYKKAVRKKLREAGLLTSSGMSIYDKNLGVEGHIDAVTRRIDLFGIRRNQLLDIEVLSDKQYQSSDSQEVGLDKLNFLMHATGEHTGGILYINRDSPDETRFVKHKYSAGRFRAMVDKLESARTEVRGMLASGQASRADLYDNVTRFEILSDVASYSDEWFELRDFLADDESLSPAEKTRYQSAKKRASSIKKRYEFAPYKYNSAKLKSEDFTIDHIIDANTIMTKEGEVVKLAGVRASSSRASGHLSDKTVFQKLKNLVTKPIKRSINEAFEHDIAQPISEAVKSLSPWGHSLDSDTDDDPATKYFKSWLTDKLPFTRSKISKEISKAKRSFKKRIHNLFVDEDATVAEKMYGYYGLEEGSHFQLMISADPEEQRGSDMYNALHGVIIKNGVNVNKSLLKRGIAEEKKTDISAAGVLARFSDSEKMAGGIWERLAHLDTPINTKFLRVRSAYEQYVRGNVYGKDSGTWEHPFSSYVWPTIDSYVVRNPIISAASMGLFASMFGATRSMKGKLGLYGAIAGASLSLLTHAREAITGKPWIPGRTRKRRDIEEYYDILKYMKYKALYQYSSVQAKAKEHFDVEEFARRESSDGKTRKEMAQALTDVKVDMKKTGRSAKAELEEINRQLKAGKNNKNVQNASKAMLAAINKTLKDESGTVTSNSEAKEMIKAINKELKATRERKETKDLGPWSTQALLYKHLSDATMYGIASSKETANFKDVLTAIPKYEREIVQGVLKDSTPEERKKFYRLLPDYQKRILGNSLGIKDDSNLKPPPTLEEYFKTHTLPGAEWEGWSPTTNLADLKAQTVKFEKLDPMDFGLYPQSISRAEAATVSVGVPSVNGRSSDIQATLKAVLGSSGLSNARVSVQLVEDPYATSDSVSVDMHLTHDRHTDLRDALRDA